MIQELQIKTKEKEEIVDITEKIKKIVKESNKEEGICLVFTKHTSAAITINENEDPNINIDILNGLKELVPDNKNWLHNKRCNNAAAHIKVSLVGQSELIPIKDNELQLGTYQGIDFVELDGPRTRTVIVQII